MEINNCRYEVSCEYDVGWMKVISSWVAEQLKPNEYPLRFAIVSIADGKAVIEATIVRYASETFGAEEFANIEILTPREKRFQSARFGVVQIVPSGVRCEWGGYAGDACPATNLLATAVDFIVTHPNTVNASEINEMAKNVLYVEGKSLDDFMLGHVGLEEVRSNDVGTVMDRSGVEKIDYVVNTLNAAIATKGIKCDKYNTTARDLGVRVEWAESGSAVGSVLEPEAIIDSARLLVEHGASAIGLISVLHGITEEMFEQHLRGLAPNPSGGAEAIISHLISKLFKLPTAHAPLPYYQHLKSVDTTNPRASAEFISVPHYFCVLKGLHQAPQIRSIDNLESPPGRLITINNVGAVVLPATCLGGIPALAADYAGIPIIAVRDNESILDVTAEKMKMSNVIEVNSYFEAAGVVAALREGISIESVSRPLDYAREVASTDMAAESMPLRRIV